jgi:O-antigen ligase
LPFTSLPFASKLLGSEMVAAPSILVLLILLLLLLLNKNQKSLFSHLQIQPLLIFGVFAFLSSILSFWLPIPIQKNFSILQNSIRGLGTLLIGISFYFVTINLIKSKNKLDQTLKVVIVSFIPLAIWSILQYVFGQMLDGYPHWMQQIQQNLTTSGGLYRDRLTGFAFEPSWLAHQMNMFYIPLWISASFTRQSVFKKWKNFFIVEDMFLLISIFTLIFSKSRVGLITFVFVLSYIFYRINHYLITKIQERYRTQTKKILTKVLPFLIIVLYIILLILGLFFFSQFDNRMENLFKVETYQNRNIFSIANDFVFAERILYWQTGWKIFNDYPIFGVGLENVGFFFEEKMPGFAWALDEPRHLMYQADYQGNIKNLWFRLLAETGVIGFLSFAVWLFLLFVLVKQYQKINSSVFNYWEMVGKIALISLLVEGFSIDSFAMPYYWIILGLVSSKYLINKSQEENQKSE